MSPPPRGPSGSEVTRAGSPSTDHQLVGRSWPAWLSGCIKKGVGLGRLSSFWIGEWPSHKVWTRQNAIDSAKHIFGDSTKRSIDTAPLRFDTADEFKGLGPHDVSWAELDVLASQAPAYADALEAAGVLCERKEWQGTFHAFMTLQPQASVSQDARKRYLDTLRKHLPLDCEV
ncbi:hypothetical protein QFC24_006653 [Naganishia onofrii]|uniref:Uncharacterized protein n=1 Tax=Naganishia onofrii TaxID=1851511 RepID=A0ACC2X1W2_9TREE|nr:hypothetical protein QFC24_006653 [Naganishia onofrii]